MEKINFKQLFTLTLAGMINAFGITVFLSPVKLYDSGISGTSMLLSQLTPEWLSLSVFLLLLNIPLFLYGLKKQGRQFTICAVYTVFIYSLCAFLITDVLPIDVS
ncbi:MAG: YitT family protein, partial [Clostridia bacterium]|nr:YitT family protein [Clostridia bacterium]